MTGRKVPGSAHLRVAVVLKRTSYRTFVEERKDPHITSLIARGDPTARRMRRTHDAHNATVTEVKEALAALGAEAHVYEGARTRIDAAYDLVVTVGGDGTLLTTSHQIGPETPILGVNSAPESSVGFFCGATKGEVRAKLEAALDRTLEGVELARMRVEKNGKVLHDRVLNEALFCHASPAATSRYILELTRPPRALRGEAGSPPPAEVEEQKSSGIWVGPAAGSTAAQRSAGGVVMPLTSRNLQYVVREPYTPAGNPLKLRVGLVDEEGAVTLRSKMRDGKLFLDGHHNVHDVEMGDVLTLRRSDEALTVLGLGRFPDSADDAARDSSRRV